MTTKMTVKTRIYISCRLCLDHDVVELNSSNPPNVARLYKKEPGYEAKVSLHSLVLRTSHKLVAQSWQRFLVVPDNK